MFVKIGFGFPASSEPLLVEPSGALIIKYTQVINPPGGTGYYPGKPQKSVFFFSQLSLEKQTLNKP